MRISDWSSDVCSSDLLKAAVSTDPAKAFAQINQDSAKGKWKVVFFWPKDFTFVCPTEIAAFGKLNGDFNDRDTVVYGASTDSDFVHLAWRRDNEDQIGRESRRASVCQYVYISVVSVSSKK